jgi:hypothetical protein
MLKAVQWLPITLRTRSLPVFYNLPHGLACCEHSCATSRPLVTSLPQAHLHCLDFLAPSSDTYISGHLPSSSFAWREHPPALHDSLPPYPYPSCCSEGLTREDLPILRSKHPALSLSLPLQIREGNTASSANGDDKIGYPSRR